MKNNVTLYAVLVTVLAFTIVTAGSGLAAPPHPKEVDFWLTILHNGDGESKLISLGSGVLEDFGGAARFKSVVDNLKWAATLGKPFEGQTGAKSGVIMVSSGDNMLAGPEWNANRDKETVPPFYDTIALDYIGYDVLAIGNHDFDFGPDVLADFIEGYELTHPPYLSANLGYSGEPRLQALFDEGRIAFSTVINERGDLIGMVSATTPNLKFISSPRNVEVDTDVAAAVQREVDKLEAMGIEKIIFISHMQDINGDIALAGQLSGVDIMVAGGSDELLANPGDLLVPGDEGFVYGPYPMMAVGADGKEILVVTTSGQYAYVGRLVVGFDKNGQVVAVGDNSGPVRVAGDDCGGTVPCDDAVPPDPMVQALVVDPVSDFVADLANNILATSEVDLDGTRSEVRTEETNEGNLIADSLLWQATQLAADFGVPAPDVALQNGGGIRNNSIIPAGDITELDTFNMAPFPNFVTVFPAIPRNQFKEILENAVSCIDTTLTGSGRFAQISGFTFTYDTTGTPMLIDFDGTVIVPGTRIEEVILNNGTVIVTGGSVVAGSDLTVSTIDFLARGGDQYPFRDAAFTVLGVSYQQALSNYIVDGLGGLISAADYPEGGEGRITKLP